MAGWGVAAASVERLTSGGWRVLGLERDEPRVLLERGLALLEGMVRDPTPTLRWYVPTRTAIVLGRGQAPALAARSTSEVEVLVRHSGGGAVLLDPSLLSLDVLVPAVSPLLAGDLGDVFVRIGGAFAAALGDLGIPELSVHEGPGMARRQGTPREQLLASVCYATPGRGEVLAGGRKVVGLAQRRRRHGALVQCGVLLRWRPRPLLEALGADPDDPEIAAAAIGLEDLGTPAPTDVEVIAAVERRLDAMGEGPG